MNALFARGWPFSEAVVEHLGWVLVHSLWQLAFVALIAGLTVRVLRRNSAATRYGMLTFALAVAVMVPVATWAWLPINATNSVDDLASPTASTSGLELNLATSPSADATRLAGEEGPPVEAGVGSAILRKSPLDDSRAVKHQVGKSRKIAAPTPHPSWSGKMKATLQPWLAWLVATWSLGVVLCSLRPLLGWYTLHRLQREGVSPVSADIQAALHRISMRLGLRHTVRVLQSTLAQVPVVVGYLRPVILLPVSLLTNIPPAQLEAILAHELAHVRRHDFVVNLLQTLVETIFFYHPAVWWLSRQIRVEREHCCDDVVIALLGNRVEYGRALLAVEELRGHSTLLAPGASDGSLLSRLRRIVSVAPDRSSVSRLSDRWPVAFVTLFSLLTLACGTFVSSRAQENSPKRVPLLDPIVGEVVDAATGAPITGATVRYRFRKVHRDPNQKDEPVAELVFRDVGRFTFQLPDGVDGKSEYFVERTAEHPNYQTLGPAGNFLSLILKGEPNQARDFIRKVKLSAGKVVTGRVLDLDGRPAKNIVVTSGRDRQGWQNGCEHKTTTDADGRYRLVVPTNHGRGRIYLIPDHAAAVSRAISTSYGEQEVFQLRRGTRLQGSVLDSQGRGVARVVVRANGGERVPWRYALTDDTGRYSLPPCQYGEYTVELMDEGRLPEDRPQGIRLPEVYVAQAISLPKTAPSEMSVDFRPIETVRVTARYTTSDGTPVVGSRLTFFGGMNRLPWFGKFRDIPGEPGKYELRAPRGLQHARIDQDHDHDSSGIYFLRITRQSGDSGEHSGNWFPKLDQDDDSLQIRRFKAAKLTLRLTLDGKPQTGSNLIRWPEFADPQSARKLGAGAVTGMGIEHHSDGSQRMHVHPEIEIKLKSEGSGFKPWQETIRLKEGENREIEVRLQSNGLEVRKEREATDPFVAQLPNGLTVELIGLAEMSMTPKEWWRPDGSALGEVPQYDKNALKPAVPKERRGVIRVLGAKNSQDVIANDHGVRMDFARSANDGDVTTDVRVFPVEGRQTGRVEVGVATEPLSPVRVLDAHGDKVAPATNAPVDHIAEDIKVEIVVRMQSRSPQTAADAKERTAITFVAPVPAHRQFDLDLKLIDRDGQPHDREYVTNNGQSAPRNELTYVFDVPFERVARFEYRMRLFRHWITFDNVSLDPGQETGVKVGVESVKSATPRRFEAELPDRLKVEFVGITKNTAPAREGWRQDGSPLGDVGYWPSTIVLHHENTSSAYTENGPHPEPDANAIDLLFLFHGLKAQPSFAFDLPALGSSFHNNPVKDPYQLRVSTLRRGEPPPGAKWSIPDGEFHVGLTDEPWGRFVKINPDGKVVDPIRPDDLHASTYRLIEIVGTKPQDRIDTGTAIVLRAPVNQTDPENPLHRYAFEFRAIDTEGKVHWALEWEGRGIEGTKMKESQWGLAQPLPAGKVLSHFEYRLRPYRHWVKFQGVSLEPGKESDVKVSVESLPITKPETRSAPPPRAALPAPTAASWSSFRHDLAQTGVATSPLPDKLEKLWEVSVGDEVPGTAAIVGDHVYVPCLSGELVCLDRRTGNKIWAYRSVTEVEKNSFAPGFKSSPMVTADSIFLGDESGVFHAIDRATGKPRWTFKTDGEIHSSAAVFGGRVLFGSYDRHLYCLHETDGTLAWKFATEGNVHCTPAVVDGLALIAGCDNHLRVIEITTGTEKTDIPLGTYLIASPTVIGDHVFVGHQGGEVLCVNWKTKNIVWRYAVGQGEFPFHSSTAVTDKLVILGGSDKLVHAIDRMTGKKAWTFATGGKVDSSPVVVGQRVFIGSDDGNLYELDVATGAEHHKYNLGSPISASPAIGEGVLVIGSESRDGKVVCFGGP